MISGRWVDHWNDAVDGITWGVFVGDDLILVTESGYAARSHAQRHNGRASCGHLTVFPGGGVSISGSDPMADLQAIARHVASEMAARQLAIADLGAHVLGAA